MHVASACCESRRWTRHIPDGYRESAESRTERQDASTLAAHRVRAQSVGRTPTVYGREQSLTTTLVPPRGLCPHRGAPRRVHHGSRRNRSLPKSGMVRPGGTWCHGSSRRSRRRVAIPRNQQLLLMPQHRGPQTLVPPAWLPWSALTFTGPGGSLHSCEGIEPDGSVGVSLSPARSRVRCEASTYQDVTSGVEGGRVRATGIKVQGLPEAVVDWMQC